MVEEGGSKEGKDKRILKLRKKKMIKKRRRKIRKERREIEMNVMIKGLWNGDILNIEERRGKKVRIGKLGIEIGLDDLRRDLLMRIERGKNEKEILKIEKIERKRIEKNNIKKRIGNEILGKKILRREFEEMEKEIGEIID